VKHLLYSLLFLTSICTPLHAQLSCNHGGAEDDLLRLTAHANVVVGGGKSGDFNHALHGHDPERGFRLQGLELGAFSNFSTYTQIYGNLNLYEDGSKAEAEWEEGYLKIHRLPYGFEARGGRFYNLVGTQNNIHLHDWQFVDADLMTSTFLGEDGLAINGGELSWYYIYENYGVVGLNLAAGQVVSHSDHAEASTGGHAHGEELAGFQGNVLSMRSTVHHYTDDFHQHFIGVSGVIGENGYGKENYVLELDYTYSWNDRDGDTWGKSLDTTIQLGLKNTEWVHPDDSTLSGTGDQTSLMLQSVYGFRENWTVSARAEWIQGLTAGALTTGGVTEYGIDEDSLRRFSLAVTRQFKFGDSYTGKIRLQYNHDKRDNQDEHSIWLQLGGGASWSW